LTKAKGSEIVRPVRLNRRHSLSWMGRRFTQIDSDWILILNICVYPRPIL